MDVIQDMFQFVGFETDTTQDQVISVILPSLLLDEGPFRVLQFVIALILSSLVPCGSVLAEVLVSEVSRFLRFDDGQKG
jgi:hypothetical protein